MKKKEAREKSMILAWSRWDTEAMDPELFAIFVQHFINYWDDCRYAVSYISYSYNCQIRGSGHVIARDTQSILPQDRTRVHRSV